jgi:hypothetical protein
VNQNVLFLTDSQFRMWQLFSKLAFQWHQQYAVIFLGPTTLKKNLIEIN